MSKKPEKPILPPYISYTTFINFINGLKETGIPHQVDRSVLRSLSGATQSATIAALKFLDLIDVNARPTKKLAQLVDASDEKYNTVLNNVLSASYSFLFENDFDLAHATGNLVESKFREKGVSGSTITKCITFFLAAAKDAGIKISTHVRPPPIVRSNESKKTGTKKKRVKLIDHDDTKKSPVPPESQSNWHEQLLAKFPAFDPKWDEETQKAWFTAFSELMKQGKGD